MKDLQGDRLLSDLSIPGTHNSCARYGGPYAKCQEWSLTKQLEAGARFFDIRCRNVKDELQIYHGIMSQGITFSEVQKECLAFLKRNPSECIILSIKKEGASKGHSKSLGEIFKEQVKGKYYYQGAETPRLGDVRGRLVVVSRHHTVAGIPWKSMKIQDHYKVSGSSDIERKWQQVKAHFILTAKDQSSAWKVNFISGNGFFSTPRRVARNLNPRLEAHLKKSGAKLFGTILLDFPNEELIKTIFKRN